MLDKVELEPYEYDGLEPALLPPVPKRDLTVSFNPLKRDVEELIERWTESIVEAKEKDTQLNPLMGVKINSLPVVRTIRRRSVRLVSKLFIDDSSRPRPVAMWDLAWPKL